MHQRIKIKKQQFCLICFQNIFYDFSFRSFNFKKSSICQSCQQKMQKINKRIDILNCNVWILYYYNDFLKQLIFQYKGCYDITLAPVFLEEFLPLIKKRFHDYLVVFPPSNEHENQKRGFIHLEEIVKTFTTNYLHVFYKKTIHKQSDLSYDKRSMIQDVIGFKYDRKLEHQKILLIDDILTSGNTIKTCIQLLQKNIKKLSNISIICVCTSNKKYVEI